MDQKPMHQIPGLTMNECGCKAVLNIGLIDITYCPMHKQARAMRNALEAASGTIKILGRNNSSHGIDMVLKQIEDALKK